MDETNNDDIRQPKSPETLHREIERKFLIDSLPQYLQDYPHHEIEQGYLAITEDGTEIRLRKQDNQYFQTIKIGDGKTRIETEIEISKEQFTALWNFTEKQRIKKTRFKIPYYNNLTIELDVYHDNLTGLFTAEIEFINQQESLDLVTPDWFGKEVTDDPQYKNHHLAVHGFLTKLSSKPKNFDAKFPENVNIPEYQLEEGIEKLVDRIRFLKENMLGNIIVEIAGGSASGKTSAVADLIKKVFGDEALMLSLDDYYRGKTFMEESAAKGVKLNWDQPETLDLGLFRQHLLQLKAGHPISKPVYDFKTGEPAGKETVNPKKIIVVEGLFSLHETLQDQGDINVFVEIGTHGRIVRRLLRDVQRTGQKPADILLYFSQVVEPMHDLHVQSTRKNADMVIINEYSPKAEAERSGLHEVQLKFQESLEEEDLRRLGAEKLSTTKQVDEYYHPKDRDMIQTGEILRIRTEEEKITLTYKGPKIDSKFRERPKFEFDLDAETKVAFLNIYGNKKKTICKKRTIYQLDGIVFSLDQVSKLENGIIVYLGEFVEIRTTDKEDNQEKILALIGKLGLNPNSAIRESYFEM
jgi:adenylate cyclase